MNPFLESTVARPLEKNHPDHCWSGSTPLATTRPMSSSQGTKPCNPPGEAASTAYALIKRDHSASLSQANERPRRRVSSRCTALALGLCVSFSAITGLLSKPVFLAGGIAVAGILTPVKAMGLDLNSATLQQLQSLKGIGPKTAMMIIDERNRGGAFTSLTDLSDRVRGIGPKRAAALQAAGLTIKAASGTVEPRKKPPQNQKTRQ